MIQGNLPQDYKLYVEQIIHLQIIEQVMVFKRSRKFYYSHHDFRDFRNKGDWAYITTVTTRRSREHEVKNL